MNLRPQAHEGHRAFVWPQTKHGPTLYCRDCDVFLTWDEDPLDYIEVPSLKFHQAGTGPANGRR